MPISVRYPIVELVVGLSLALIAVGQLYRLSLPGLAVGHTVGPLWAPVIEPVVLIALLFHTYAMTISWAFALVRFDGHRLPVRLVAWGLLVITGALLALPALAITSWRTLGLENAANQWPQPPQGISLYVDALLRVLTALVASAILGRSLARGLCPTADPKLDPLGNSTRELMDLIAILAIPALSFGWQSAIAVAVVASLLAAILRSSVLRRTTPLGCFGIAISLTSTLHLFFWNTLHQWSYWPSDNSEPVIILSWAAVILFTPLWLGSGRRESPGLNHHH